MEIEKFKSEVNTLKDFFQCYCHNKHEKQEQSSVSLFYKDEIITIELLLCKTCKNQINYSFDKLLNCPHEIKPRCRTCSNPCYDKENWKKTAKIMKYSGVKLGLSKLNKTIKNLFTKNKA